MNAKMRIDRRFDEALIQETWELLVRHGFRPSLDPAHASLAVFWLHETCRAFEGKVE